MDLSDLRQEYARAPLDVDSVDADPLQQFEKWFGQARDAELLEPNAMVLSTVDDHGRPAQRTVLLKYFDADGLVFFTNYKSRKAQHLAANDHASLLFQWLPLHRQLEIGGRAERVAQSESLRYFLKRPRGSQIGAWVSMQSQVISSRSLLESKLAELKERFAGGEVPLPSFWGGFRVVPQRFEFWQGGPHRLHDRVEYLRRAEDQWTRERLSP